jgi:hypothetical protein
MSSVTAVAKTQSEADTTDRITPVDPPMTFEEKFAEGKSND